MDGFKSWYMDLYWKFDNLFLEGAKLLGITYHEFVLITLVIVWPAITFGLSVAVVKLWRDRRRLLAR
jgi:hypothetical protein